MQISRSSYFQILGGATLAYLVTDESYYRSPIVQGDVEILCKLRVRMIPTLHNRSIAAHFETLVSRFYAEPANQRKESKVKKKLNVVHLYSSLRDIRSFLRRPSC